MWLLAKYASVVAALFGIYLGCRHFRGYNVFASITSYALGILIVAAAMVAGWEQYRRASLSWFTTAAAVFITMVAVCIGILALLSTLFGT